MNTETLLLQYGIPQNLLGFQYISYAVELAAKDKGRPKLVKGIYPAVARRYNTTASAVERSIRNAIKVSFDRCSADTIWQNFGNSVRPSSGVPTNAEFIARIACQVKNPVQDMERDKLVELCAKLLMQLEPETRAAIIKKYIQQGGTA